MGYHFYIARMMPNSSTPKIQPPSNSDGYKVIKGSTLATPRRTGMILADGGEPWRLSPSTLYKTEMGIKRKIRESGQGVGTDKINTDIARKVAGARAEARVGYSVDGLHRWSSTTQHPMYITTSQPRVALATQTMEDIFDAVSQYLILADQHKLTMIMQVHALDRVSDANIICMISLSESMPSATPLATIHQYISRSIIRCTAGDSHTMTTSPITQLVASFRDLVAQPSTDHLTRSITEQPWESDLLAAENDASEIEGLVRDFGLVQVSAGAEVAEGSQTNRGDQTDDTDWFASPTLQSNTRSHPPVELTTLAALLDFGGVVEEALDRLKLSETEALKVKLIAAVAKEQYWPGMFQELGLSADGASLMTVILGLRCTRVV
jgi:hypothetical protein